MNKTFLISAIIFLAVVKIAYADPIGVDLTIRDGASLIFSGVVSLEPAGLIDINDSDGTPHSTNADSVLAVLNDADILSPDFSVSTLTFYNLLDAFYLKCLTAAGSEKCDNWQYAVNGSYPPVGMDKYVLGGGENVYIFFGSEYKVRLSANQATTTDHIIVAAQSYDYENDSWVARLGVTIGVTKPNPDDPYNPIEIQTLPVDGNGQADFTLAEAGTYNAGVKEDFYFPLETFTITAPPDPIPTPKPKPRYQRTSSRVIEEEIPETTPATRVEENPNNIPQVQEDNKSTSESPVQVSVLPKLTPSLVKPQTKKHLSLVAKKITPLAVEPVSQTAAAVNAKSAPNNTLTFLGIVLFGIISSLIYFKFTRKP